jgi:hypothetical protein
MSADQFGRRAAGPQQLAHGVHRGPDVAEERLVAGAQVMQARLAVGRGREPVLGTAAVAGEPDVAVQAVPGQRVPLSLPEFLLLG